MLRGRGRRSGSQISREIRDCRIRLMPDSGDNGNRRHSDGSRHPLIIEAGEIFKRPAAADKQNHFCFFGFPCPPERFRDLGRGSGSLD